MGEVESRCCNFDGMPLPRNFMECGEVSEPYWSIYDNIQAARGEVQSSSTDQPLYVKCESKNLAIGVKGVK